MTGTFTRRNGGNGDLYHEDPPLPPFPRVKSPVPSAIYDRNIPFISVPGRAFPKLENVPLFAIS